MTVPACWAWPVTGAEHEQAFQAALAGGRDGEAAGLRLLETWQAKRCAACGSSARPLDADHDHDTGYLRGLLCHSCNVQEAHAWAGNPLFGRYRLRSPAVILGVKCYWSAPDSRRAVLAALGPDPLLALMRYQAERDPEYADGDIPLLAATGRA